MPSYDLAVDEPPLGVAMSAAASSPPTVNASNGLPCGSKCDGFINAPPSM